MAAECDDTDTVTVSTGDVTVEKFVSTDEFPVPTVVFDLRSTAAEPVEIRLTDEIPESIDMGAVGFHPDYDGESWTAYRDRRVGYETTLAPGESVRTVYGVRADAAPEPETFLVEPRLELRGEDDTDEPDGVVHEPTETVHEVLATDDAATDRDDETGEPTVGGVESEAETGAALGGADATDPAALAAALAEAVREDAVADEDLATLREALSPEPTPPTSVQVRIDRLQSQVEDLSAYTGALETFLDEEGEGRAAVAGFRADLEALTAEVGDLDDAVGSLDERVVDVEGEVDALDAELDTLSADLEALDEEVSAVAGDLEETRGLVEDVDDELDRRLADLSARVDDIDEDTAELATEVERLGEFRERLSSAFGPGDEA